MKPDRAQRLADIGSTTALSAMVEIMEGRQARRLIEITAGRQSKPVGGILARQATAMLKRLDPQDQDDAIAGFCDELQTFVESVPGIRRAIPDRARRKA